MSTKSKSYSSELKSKVVLELLSGDGSLLELCSKYKLPKSTVKEWKSKGLSEFSSLFSNKNSHKKEVNLLNKKIENLHNIIGELSVENNFLKKKL